MMKTNIELAAAAEKVAKNFRTLYVRGCFGAPMNDSNKNRYTNNHSFNKQDVRKDKILAAGADTFGFDCVCFIKGLLWGWVGDTTKEYGGATYQSNGVPDINTDSMMKQCVDVSEDFSNLCVGEYLWIEGHCGLYIGNGLTAECTHRWADGVQITRVHNILPDDGTPGRSWDKHGKLPWITYVENGAIEAKPLEVGDVVNFAGGKVYNSEDAAGGSTGKAGEAKVTKIVPGAAHPIHLQRTGKVGPWGWVDESSIQKPAEPEPAPPVVTAERFSVELPILRRGDQGEVVRALQHLLIANGYNCGTKGADGKFGINTEEAVKTFQKKGSLLVTGVADAATWANLLGVET